MPNARLNRIEVVGFRSYGQSAQSVDLPQTAAVFWGGNSQGFRLFHCFQTLHRNGGRGVLVSHTVSVECGIEAIA